MGSTVQQHDTLTPCQYLSNIASSSISAQYPASWSCPNAGFTTGSVLMTTSLPLNIKDIVKPLPNENVIRIEKGVQTIEDCKNKCEDVSTCTFYTLYKDDLNKNCQIVGFNLGNACNYLSNVCVLLKSCKQFDQSCDRACVTGRRLIQDETKDYRTLLVGGVKAQRLSIVEYETSIEVLNQYGEKSCEKMTTGNNWDKTNTIDMVNTRAFHSMVATDG